MTVRRSFDTLNLLRGLAAIAVVAWHYPGVDGRSYWSGYLSVDLFFVLSGVVVAHAYETRLRDGWRLHRFVLARVIRLWPLYLLGTAIGAAASAAATLHDGAQAWRFRPLAWQVLEAAVLWPQSGGVVRAAFPLDPPAWSLFCELAVNLLYGAALARARFAPLAATAALGAAAMTAGAIWGDQGSALNLGAIWSELWIGVARACFSFPVGVLIHRAAAAGRLPRLRVPPAALAALFLLLLVALPVTGPWALPSALAAVLVAMPLLVAAAVQVEPAGALLRVARVTADLSYALYAVHDALFLAAGIAVAMGRVPPVPAYLGAAAAALLLAPLADRFADRPLRRLLSRAADMPRTAAVAAPPL